MSTNYPTITVITVRFAEDDVYEGSIPTECYEDAWERREIIEFHSIPEAVEILKSRGLTFAATGGAWAADPDGSRVVDYATGTREEVSAHLDNVSAHAEKIIVARVG